MTPQKANRSRQATIQRSKKEPSSASKKAEPQGRSDSARPKAVALAKQGASERSPRKQSTKGNEAHATLVMAPVTSGAAPLLGTSGASFSAETVGASVNEGLQGWDSFGKSLIEQANRLWTEGGAFPAQASSGTERPLAVQGGSVRGVVSAPNSYEGEGTNETDQEKIATDDAGANASNPANIASSSDSKIGLNAEEKEERKAGIESYFVDKYGTTPGKLIGFGNKLSFILKDDKNSKQNYPNLESIERTFNGFHAQQTTEYQERIAELEKRLIEAQQQKKPSTAMDIKKSLANQELNKPTFKRVATTFMQRWSIRYAENQLIREKFLLPYLKFREEHPKINSLAEVLTELENFKLLKKAPDADNGAHYQLGELGEDFAPELIDSRWPVSQFVTEGPLD